MDNNIKDAFSKVKEDITILQNELFHLKNDLIGTKNTLNEIKDILKQMNENHLFLNQEQQKIREKLKKQTQTQPQITNTFSTHTSTQSKPLEALKDQNISISTGNKGVPADRQTDQQTDISAQFQSKEEKNSFDNATEILNSLDNIKKEIRLKFKRLTDQEWIVFSTIYQLEEEKGFTDYYQIAAKLSLTESSIRDYVSRLIKKGIPIEKSKINNKMVNLSISQNLKKIATLPTILQLRDL